MSEDPKKPLFPAFGTAAQSATLFQGSEKTSVPEVSSRSRYKAFFGAIFNSLDSYFRERYAQEYSPLLYSTAYQINDDRFSLIIKAQKTPDDEESGPNTAAWAFFKEIYDIASENELFQMSCGHKFNPETGENIYCLTVIAPLELIELVEHLLKPYNFNDATHSMLRFSDTKESEHLSFALFPQYSIQHIRALLHHAQGRNPEGYGPQLSH